MKSQISNETIFTQSVRHHINLMNLREMLSCLEASYHLSKIKTLCRWNDCIILFTWKTEYWINIFEQYVTNSIFIRFEIQLNSIEIHFLNTQMLKLFDVHSLYYNQFRFQNWTMLILFEVKLLKIKIMNRGAIAHVFTAFENSTEYGFKRGQCVWQSERQRLKRKHTQWLYDKS